MENENKTPKNECKACARRDEMIAAISEKNDEYRREIERLNKELERRQTMAIAV